MPKVMGKPMNKGAFSIVLFFGDSSMLSNAATPQAIAGS
jgi:hypothetical protein